MSVTPSKSKVDPDARIASRLNERPSQPKPVTTKPAPSPCSAANAAGVAAPAGATAASVDRSTSDQS